MRERHLGPITTTNPDGTTFTVDLDMLIRRILLFEDCYLESSLLREIPKMVELFGLGPVMDLLDDPHFHVISDFMGPASFGGVDDMPRTDSKGKPLPLGDYSIVLISISPKNGFHGALENVQQTPGINNNQRKKLKLKLVDCVSKYPIDVGAAALGDFAKDITTGTDLLTTVLTNVIQTTDFNIKPNMPLKLEVHKLSEENDYRVVSNLVADFNVDERIAHKAVDRALLGIAAINQRLRLMQHYQAVTGFQDNDALTYEAKLKFIYQQIDPTAQEARFKRVSELGTLPSIEKLGSSAKVDLHKLMRLRDDPDCIALRRWLRTTDGSSDTEIQDQFNSVREKLANITHTKFGKAVRFIATSGVGAIPVVGIVAGPISNLADQYIAEKLIGTPGPVCFLSHKYKSIFET